MATPLTREQLTDWTSQLLHILEDCERCLSHLDRLDASDEATISLYESGTGYYLVQMNMFVLITQAAKVFCRVTDQALALPKLLGALKDPGNEPMLDRLLKSPKDLPGTPKWVNVGEVHAWVHACGTALRPHTVTIEQIRQHRNTVTAHTSAIHQAGNTEAPLPSMSDLKALVNIGSTNMIDLLEGLTGWRTFMMTDDNTFDRLIDGYVPRSRVPHTDVLSVPEPATVQGPLR